MKRLSAALLGTLLFAGSAWAGEITIGLAGPLDGQVWLAPLRQRYEV